MPKNDVDGQADVYSPGGSYVDVAGTVGMWSRLYLATATFLAYLLVMALATPAADKKAFLDYANERQRRGPSRWAIFLGLGQTERNLHEWITSAKAAGAD